MVNLPKLNIDNSSLWLHYFNCSRPYNINWKLDVLQLRNSSLRQKTILYGCEPSKVGNGVCNPQCRHVMTGQDGGDCDVTQTECSLEQRGDGSCDQGCNRYIDINGGCKFIAVYGIVSSC